MVRAGRGAPPGWRIAGNALDSLNLGAPWAAESRRIDRMDPFQAGNANESLIGADQRGAVLDGERWLGWSALVSARQFCGFISTFLFRSFRKRA